MNKKIIVSICAAVVMILFAVALVNVYLEDRILENPQGTVGNTTGNLYNGGLFCETDEYVYFANPYDNYALYRMLPDETKLEKIITTPSVSINAAGNHVFYYQSSSGTGTGLGYVINTYGIRRFSKNSKRTVSGIDNALIESFVLADNSLYYQVADMGQHVNYIKEISLDGKNAEQIVLPSDALLACVDHSTMYFTNAIENFHLLAMDLNDKNHTLREILAEDIYMPIVEGNDVYCIDIHNNYALVHYNLSTGQKTVLDAARTDMLNVDDAYIYYQTSGTNPQLKRITKDGSSVEVIADGAYNSINTTSKYVYFMKYGDNSNVYKIPASGTPSVTTFTAAREAASKQK
ncbi:MAG: DUF5050 domain-containing protein [Lachnospiraceae bacterium]|nr:DUF5050 domain-containing protein [Lachnospiraceae bacterium]